MEDLNTARLMFEAWNAGNVDRMIDFWAEDENWIWEDNPSMPDAGVYVGREAVEAHLREAMSLIGDVPLTVEEVTTMGDEVLAVVTGRMEGVRSGITLEDQSAHLIRFEDGRVRRYRVFPSREEAIAAADAPGEAG